MRYSGASTRNKLLAFVTCVSGVSLSQHKEVKMKIKASLLVTTLLASASCFAADTYQVSTSVYSQGKRVAAPAIEVSSLIASK